MLKFKNFSKEQASNVDAKNQKGTEGYDKTPRQLFDKLYAENHETQHGWKKSLDINNKNISGTIHQRPNDTQGKVDYVRADMRFKNATIEQFWNMIKFGPPIEHAKKREVLETHNDYERDLHVEIKPPILSMREQLVKIKREDIGDGSTLIIISNIQSDKVPIRPNVVRAEMLKCSFLRQAEDNSSDLLWTDISEFDMKGNIPQRFMNMMISTVMSKGVNQMYAKMQEAK